MYDETLESKNYNDHSLNLKLLTQELSAGLASRLSITSRPCGAGGTASAWHSNFFPGGLNTSNSKCY